MNKRNKVKKLGKTATHRKAMINTQLTMLFETGKVQTTSGKAKVLKGSAERLLNRIDKAEEKDLNLVRLLKKKLNTEKALKYVREFVKENGTAVKLVKIGYRDGDNAELSEVYLPEFDKFLKGKEKK